jgi:hypothetical protein
MILARAPRLLLPALHQFVVVDGDRLFLLVLDLQLRREIAAVIGEDESVPAEPKVRFDPAGINIYADSWRVEMGA